MASLHGTRAGAVISAGYPSGSAAMGSETPVRQGTLAPTAGAADAAAATCPPARQSPDETSADNQAFVLKKFAVVGDLGRGSFGVVKKVRHRDTGEIFAMKMLEKRFVVQKGLEKQMEREVLIQFKAKHEHLVDLIWFFEDEFVIYCLLEYADQGQLFAYLRDQDRGVPEPRAAQFFVDTAHGVEYLHSLSIAHRDIKPENIMLFTKALRAKIADLGWCVRLTAEEPTRLTFCGTLDYMAPEMISEEPHDAAVDLWALGVLLYEMLIASAPFAAKSPKMARDLICAVKYEMPPGSMSQGPRDIVSSLLVRDPRARASLLQVLQHPWVRTLAGSLSRSTPCVAGEELMGATQSVPRTAATGSATQAFLMQATCTVPRGDATNTALMQATRAVPRGAAGEWTVRPAPHEESKVLSQPSELQPTQRGGSTPSDFELPRSAMESLMVARRPLQQPMQQNQVMDLEDVLERATVIPQWAKPIPATSSTAVNAAATASTEVVKRDAPPQPSQPTEKPTFAASALHGRIVEMATESGLLGAAAFSRQASSVSDSPSREEVPASASTSSKHEISRTTPPRSPFILPRSTPPISPRLHPSSGVEIMDSELLSTVEDSRIELEDLDSPLSAMAYQRSYAVRQAEKEFRKDGARRRTAAVDTGELTASTGTPTAPPAGLSEDKVHTVDGTTSTIASTSDDLTSEATEDLLCPKRVADGSGPRAKRRSRRRDGDPVPGRP